MSRADEHVIQIARRSRRRTIELLADFLASSFFAEDEATPVVEKLLRHPTDSEERALLALICARGGRARAHPRRRAGAARAAEGTAVLDPEGVPADQRADHAADPVLSRRDPGRLLLRRDGGARARRRRARAAAAAAARRGAPHPAAPRAARPRSSRASARSDGSRRGVFAFLFRWAFFVTAWYQARQLAPILGDAGPPLRRKILHKLRADLPVPVRPARPGPGPARLVVVAPTPARRPTPPQPRGGRMTRAVGNRRRIRIVVNPSARSGRGPRRLRDLAATHAVARAARVGGQPLRRSPARSGRRGGRRRARRIRGGRGGGRRRQRPQRARGAGQPEPDPVRRAPDRIGQRLRARSRHPARSASGARAADRRRRAPRGRRADRARSAPATAASPRSASTRSRWTSSTTPACPAARRSTSRRRCGRCSPTGRARCASAGRAGRSRTR